LNNECPFCDGSGKHWNTCQEEGDPEWFECSSCNGTGILSDKEEELRQN